MGKLFRHRSKQEKLMAIKKDYYEILGVDRTAGEPAIKSQYRKLAMKYHPDRNPGDHEAEENFKEAAEAYAVLRDPEKRGLYDRFGHEGLQNTGFSGFGGSDDIFSSFSDIFEDFFGFGMRGASATGASRGADLRYDLEIDFMDAAFGIETEILVKKQDKCDTCSGSGCKPGTSYETCHVCQGSGQVVRSQGFFSIRTTCPNCQGRGKSVSHPCETCEGSGRVLTKKKVAVKIPAGVDTGSRLRLTGEGESGIKGGPTGDLYVVLHVKPHEFFKREDTNIFCQIPLSFVDAALGTSIEVPTLTGEQTLKIPKGTQPGELFRFRGEGIPSLRGHGKGDQVIQLRVSTPTGLTKKQASLLQEFRRLESKKLSTKIKKFFKEKQ